MSCPTIYKDLAGRLALARAHAQHTQPSQPSPPRAHSTHENHTHHSTGDLTPFAALINLGQSSASSHFLFHQLQVYLLHLNARRNVSALGVITCPRHLLCDALVRAEARPPALLALAPLALVRAEARAPALLAPAPLALVRAEARAPALLASAPLSLVRAQARPPALLAFAPAALVRTKARAPALLA